MGYEIFIDYEDDTLEIIKTPSKTPIQRIEGKYGIVFCQDINDNTVKIIIPEPEILFGIPIEYLQSFLISNII